MLWCVSLDERGDGDNDGVGVGASVWSGSSCGSSRCLVYRWGRRRWMMVWWCCCSAWWGWWALLLATLVGRGGMSGTTWRWTRKMTAMKSTLRHDERMPMAMTGTYALHTNHTPDTTDSTKRYAAEGEGHSCHVRSSTAHGRWE